MHFNILKYKKLSLAKLKIILILILIFISKANSILAEDTTSINTSYHTLNGKKVDYSSEELKRDYDNKFGITYSMFSGHGFSYQRNIYDDFSIKVNGLIYGFSEKTNQNLNQGYNINGFPLRENSLYYSIGAEIQKVIFIENKLKILGFVGINYLFDDTKKIFDYTEFSTNIYKYNLVTVSNFMLSYGFGLGAQYEIQSQIFLDFSAGLGFMHLDYIHVGDSGDNSRFKNDMFLGVGGGFYYAF